MHLEIKTPLSPIDPLSAEIESGLPYPKGREVYINSERCPPELEKIILDGMDLQIRLEISQLLAASTMRRKRRRR